MTSRVVRFFVAGALLFAAQRWWMPAVEPRPGITLSHDDVAALRRGAVTSTGAALDPAELDGLIAAAVDEEILYREALANGLDREDSVVRRRLVQNMGFVGEAAAPESIDREARRLGIDDDTVVRRRLVERMRARFGADGQTEPSDRELAAYLDRHAARFALPPRVRLTHLFIAASADGSVDRRARALVQSLRANHATPEHAVGLGDPLPIPAYVGSASEQDLTARFGAELAAAAMVLPVGEWSAPLRSPYGVHLVWVHERIAAAPAALDDVRAAVREALQRERAEQAVREALARLRTRYDVSVAR